MIVQCKCDCGTEFEECDSQGRKRRFVKGHNRNRKGKTHSPATKQLMSIIKSGENHPMYGKHPSDATRQLQSDAHKGIIPSDATRQLMSDSHIGIIPSDEARKNMSDSHKGEKNSNYGKPRSPETRQKISKNRIGRYCGENNSNWNGGSSFEPYCQEWGKWLKKEIKERDNHQCQNLDCSKEITKTNPLCVHHINYQKKDCSTNNLITLCNSCNSRANSNREYWEGFYNNILMEINQMFNKDCNYRSKNLYKIDSKE